MKKWLGIAAVGFQALVLAVMAGEREWVVLTGERVHLRTAPIDPLDPFRGQYVRLDYEITTIPPPLLRDGLAGRSRYELKKDTRIYTTLSIGEDGVADIVHASDRPPDDGLFIRGRFHGHQGDAVLVRYGIEAYFVQQGRGLELELGRNRGNVQVPLELEVALGGNGLAVLTDHRWSPLGIGLQVEWEERELREPGQPVRARERLPVAVKIFLMNASERDVAILDLPGGRAFELVPDSIWQTNPWSWVGEGERRPPITDDHIRLLAPGESHETRIDLADPAWFVTRTGEEPRTVAGIEWSAPFRLVYSPPSRADSSHLRHAESIWHGRLRSQAFTGRGRID